MAETMKGKGKFYILDESIIPEAILKTAQVKEHLAKHRNMTVNEAVEEIGLSRSAFYKYRDGVFPFYEATRAKIITLQISMDNVTGMLSNCINTIAKANANILTINQGIPIQNVAIATIAFDTAELSEDLEEIINRIEQQSGVLHVEIVGQN
jgi:chorismate mutase